MAMAEYTVWIEGEDPIEDGMGIVSWSHDAAALRWAEEMDAPNDYFVLRAGDAGIVVCVSTYPKAGHMWRRFRVNAERSVDYNAQQI